MKRSKVIRLVLLGGGVATMMAACGEDRSALRRACEEARAQLRPDAEQICQRSVAGGGGSSFWFFGRSRPADTRVAAPAAPGRPAAAPAPSTRGGFGSFGFSGG